MDKVSINTDTKEIFGPDGWSCRIHRQLLCRGVRPPIKEYPRYEAKKSVMLELWGMLSTPSLTSLSGPLWTEVVAPDKGLNYR